jgi:hypothetical protein
VKKTLTVGACVLLFAALTGWHAILSQAAAGDPLAWNPKAAAAYLDQRQDWWQKWQPAARDHDTFCVSCQAARSGIGRRPLHE